MEFSFRWSKLIACFFITFNSSQCDNLISKTDVFLNRSAGWLFIFGKTKAEERSLVIIDQVTEGKYLPPKLAIYPMQTFDLRFMFHTNRMWASYGSHLLEIWNYTLSANMNDEGDDTKQNNGTVAICFAARYCILARVLIFTVQTFSLCFYFSCLPFRRSCHT